MKSWKRRAFSVARWVGSLLAIIWVATQVDIAAVGPALAALSPIAVALSMGITLLNLLAGAARWSLLLRAYDAPSPPPFFWLLRVYLIGFFFNTCLPGAIGGDVVRGVASRQAFGEHGASQGLAVVFVDRLMGLVGLMIVIVVAATLNPLPGVEQVPALGLVAGLVFIGLFAGLAVAAVLRDRLPPAVRRVVPKLPVPRKVLPMVAALGLGVLAHVMVALAGHQIVHSLAPSTSLADSASIIPLAMATTFIPLTVGGAGAREAAFVALYGLIGVDSELAVAASITMYGTYVLIALCLGLWPMPKAPSDAVAL